MLLVPGQSQLSETTKVAGTFTSQPAVAVLGADQQVPQPLALANEGCLTAPDSVDDTKTGSGSSSSADPTNIISATAVPVIIGEQVAPYRRLRTVVVDANPLPRCQGCWRSLSHFISAIMLIFHTLRQQLYSRSSVSECGIPQESEQALLSEHITTTEGSTFAVIME